MRKSAIVLTLLLSGCGAGSAGSRDNNITCINSQSVPIVLPQGQEPIVEGEEVMVEGDIDNGDGTHTVTVSGCDITITGDTTTTNDSDENHDNTTSGGLI